MSNSQHNLRRRSAQTQLLYVLIVCAILLIETACGSGAGSKQPSPISSSISSVSVVCMPSEVATNATSQCNAVVQGTGAYSSAVTWSASEGTVDGSGLVTASASPVTVTVTAASVQDTSRSGVATVTVKSPTLQSSHIVLVMEENQSYASVVGNTSDWPNLNNLISNGALATNYYANSHPSIGNYFMLTTGELLTTDDGSITVWNVDNLARRMLASGVSFKAYAEGITQGYLGGDTGLYVIRHNPFAMLSDVADSSQVAKQCIWPFTQFAADLASGMLPEFSFIVPNIDDDAHSGTSQQADAWLQTNVIGLLPKSIPFASGGDGILIVDFDEAVDSDTANGGGHVAAVFWGPSVKVGFTQTSTTVYQHQSMLRTVVEALRLSNPPGAAASAPSMSEFFVQK
jgi:hypothetical protein